MKTFKACVMDKQTKKYVVIESDYQNKTDFIKDLRLNGYKVCEWRVKEKSAYDHIVNNTNGQREDWINN